MSHNKSEWRITCLVVLRFFHLQQFNFSPSFFSVFIVDRRSWSCIFEILLFSARSKVRIVHNLRNVFLSLCDLVFLFFFSRLLEILVDTSVHTNIPFLSRLYGLILIIDLNRLRRMLYVFAFVDGDKANIK